MHSPVAALVSDHGNKYIVELDPSGAWETIGDVGPNHVQVSVNRVLNDGDPNDGSAPVSIRAERLEEGVYACAGTRYGCGCGEVLMLLLMFISHEDGFAR
jgi:hypothetical protein